MPLLQPLENSREALRSGKVLHRIGDEVVESYLPILEHVEDAIESLHDVAFGASSGLCDTSDLNCVTFGMSIAYPDWTRSQWFFGSLLAVTLAVTAFLLWFLRRPDYVAPSSTAATQSTRRRRASPERLAGAAGCEDCSGDAVAADGPMLAITVLGDACKNPWSSKHLSPTRASGS